MSLRINSNIAAMNAYRNLSVTDNQMSKSLEKLSSGYRINRAADDAAGLAISEGMRSQIGGLQVAARNTQDGINVVQTADGALNESTSILQRMRDLSVQASNDGGLSDDAKTNIQTEMSQLKDELTRIAGTTKFNGTSLLDGNYNGTFQVGANSGETIKVTGVTDMSAKGLSLESLDVTTDATTGFVEGLKVGDTVTDTAATAASTTTSAAFDDTAAAALATADGATQFKVNNQVVDLSGVTTAQGVVDKINGTSGVGATASLSGGKLVITSNSTGASSKADVVSSTSQFATAVAGKDAVTHTATDTDVTANDAKGSGAYQAIKAIDKAISSVSTARANLGAYQNRFEHTINNINVAVENLSASESAIRDTDMASEMTNYTKQQILQQAGTAMLAQANQAPQGVLRLLQG